MADFNGDGIPDLAIIGGAIEPFVLIWLGNGDGTFRQRALVVGPQYALSCGTGDLNGDGKADLVVQEEACAGYYCSDATAIYLGNGDGTFEWAGYTYPNVGYWAPVITDLNGDGKQDIAAGGGDDAWVALGNGDGTFGMPASYGAGFAGSIAFGDFNHDGKKDLAANGAGTVDILLGNGDGTFQPQIQFVTGGCSSAVVAADFNGDGKPDVATANNCSNSVTILLNSTE